MALTVTSTSRTVKGSDTMQSLNLTGDSSYPAGGYNLSGVDNTLLLSVIRRIISIRPTNFATAPNQAVLTNTFGPAGALTNINFRIMVVNTGAELATGTSTAGFTWHMILEGN